MACASIFEQILDYANRADPYPLYRELRKVPVRREPTGAYVVSRYRDIVALLHDPRVSSVRPFSETPGVPPSFIRTDPPEHDRIRRTLNRHYGPPDTPGRIEALRPRIHELAAGLIDQFAGKSQIDLVDDFAYPLPVTVICWLLGVPREDEPRFHVWADAIIEAVGPTGAVPREVLERQNQARTELSAYLGDLADAHHRRPGDDLMSALVTDENAMNQMSRAELTSHMQLLLVAGHETTVNLITNGMLTLLRHPDILQRLRREPEFAVRTVEELLRYEPPVHFINREALADIDIAGTTIPAGAGIILVHAAGSRDPDHVADPDRFNPDRTDPEGYDFHRMRNEHLGFGGGIHYCFGAPLARLETQIALTELVRRLENPRLLTDPPPYRPNALLRGPQHLPLGFDRILPARASGVPEPRGAGEHPTERPSR